MMLMMIVDSNDDSDDEHLETVEEVVPDDDDGAAARGPALAGGDGLDAGDGRRGVQAGVQCCNNSYSDQFHAICDVLRL